MESVIHFQVLHRNTQTAIIVTLLYMHNPRHKKGGFTCSAGNCMSVLSFQQENTLLSTLKHSYILYTLHSTRFFRKISLKQNVSTPGGIRTTVTGLFIHRLVTIPNLMFLYTANCNIIIQYKPKECTFYKLIFQTLMFF